MDYFDWLPGRPYPSSTAYNWLALKGSFKITANMYSEVIFFSLFFPLLHQSKVSSKKMFLNVEHINTKHI